MSIIVYPLFSIFWGSLSNTIFGSMNGISGICPWNPMGVRHFHRKKCPGSPARFDDAAMLEQGWVPKNGCKGGLNGIIWNFMAWCENGYHKWWIRFLYPIFCKCGFEFPSSVLSHAHIYRLSEVKFRRFPRQKNPGPSACHRWPTPLISPPHWPNGWWDWEFYPGEVWHKWPTYARGLRCLIFSLFW